MQKSGSEGTHTPERLTVTAAWLKRSLIGSFHPISEFQFRWNNRQLQEMFAMVIAALVTGIALPYENFTGKTSGQAFDPFEGVPFENRPLSGTPSLRVP